MLCKRNAKNQITIPKRIVDQFSDYDYFEVKAGKDRIVLMPVKLASIEEKPLDRIREKVSSQRVFETDIEEAIQWARKN